MQSGTATFHLAVTSAVFLYASLAARTAVAETVSIKMNGKECGSAEISITPKDSKDPAPGSIIFDFKAAKEPPKECCKKYGWIQHVKPVGGGAWSYDNGAMGGMGRGVGAPSAPEKEKQPTQRPAGIPVDGRWRENPWYGAPTDPDEDKETFARNPTPQTKIGDKPDKRGDEFRTQLVCVETGEVLTTRSWTAAEPEKGKKVPPPK
jgi:hypothetical protein